MSGSTRVLPAKVRYPETGVRPLVFDGVIPLARLSRLRAARFDQSDSDGAVTVHLETGRADDGGGQVEGRLRGSLTLRCERCLQALNWPFDLAVTLRLVRSEDEERRLLDHCEPLLLEDDWLPLHALVEDEILLALPMAPAHPAGDCPQPG